MGRVKEFAIRLAENVYIRHMSDQQIISALLTRYPSLEQDDTREWLREQIKSVKAYSTTI